MVVAAHNGNVHTQTSLNVKDIEHFWAQFYSGSNANYDAGVANTGFNSDLGEL